MAEISRAHLEAAVAPEKAEISQVRHLSSYNWIEAPTPTIVVPGVPARWTPREAGHRVPKDCGVQFIAQSAARHPESPMEPLFRSLFAEDDAFDVAKVHVITERNSIRKLLSFAMRRADEKDVRDFEIDVEVVDNTAIFCRVEAATVRVIGAHEFRGYGHEYEKAYTVNAVPGSTGHHRVISYRFCGLSFIVCHETDGYVGDAAGAQTTVAYPAMSGGSGLKIGLGGQTVPLRSTLEIKTRAARRGPLPLSEVAAQLWASQTPNLVRAYHDGGAFGEARVEDVGGQVRRWEADNQPGLRRLGWLVGRVAALARECGGKARVRYDAAADRMVVVSRDGGRGDMLPRDLYAKWKKGGSA